MPWTGCHDKARAPAIDLVPEPGPSLRGGLLRGPQVIGVTGGEIAEIFPPQINGNASVRPIGQADKRVCVFDVTLLQVGRVAARKPEGLAAGIDQVKGRTVNVIFPVHLDAQTNLTEVIHAVRAPATFLGARQRRQEQARQDRDDGNHNQQLD